MIEVPKFMQRNIPIKYDDPGLIPFRAHPSDAGADLFTATSVTIDPGDMCMIDTGVSLKIPMGYVGLVFNRSNQGKKRVQLANGVAVIDADYRGSIKVLLINNGSDPYSVIRFETRIAQLIIMPIVLGQFKQWTEEEGEWNDTARGLGGFGSTGI